MNVPEILKKAERHFIAAMVVGWPAGAKGESVPNMPGYEGIPYENGSFRVMDCFCTNTKGSAGTTTILYFDDDPLRCPNPMWKPIWVMSYQGFYPKEVIPFLKRALMKNYERGEFLGGRGPFHYEDPDNTLEYYNEVDKNSRSFSNFHGIEMIRDVEEGRWRIGWHRYQGMALI